MQWKLIVMRKEKHLNQVDLAKLLNITRESYGMKERGEMQFKADEMFKISQFFEKDIEKIFLPSNFGNAEVAGGEI